MHSDNVSLCVTDDYSLDSSMASFMPGSIPANERICSTFQPRDDRFIEDVESFDITISTTNPLDIIVGSNIFNIDIYDDDGKF